MRAVPPGWAVRALPRRTCCACSGLQSVLCMLCPMQDVRALPLLDPLDVPSSPSPSLQEMQQGGGGHSTPPPIGSPEILRQEEEELRGLVRVPPMFSVSAPLCLIRTATSMGITATYKLACEHCHWPQSQQQCVCCPSVSVLYLCIKHSSALAHSTGAILHA